MANGDYATCCRVDLPITPVGFDRRRRSQTAAHPLRVGGPWNDNLDARRWTGNGLPIFQDGASPMRAGRQFVPMGRGMTESAMMSWQGQRQRAGGSDPASRPEPAGVARDWRRPPPPAQSSGDCRRLKLIQARVRFTTHDQVGGRRPKSRTELEGGRDRRRRLTVTSSPIVPSPRVAPRTNRPPHRKTSSTDNPSDPRQ